MRKIQTEDAVTRASALTVSGGGTPSATGDVIVIGDSTGSISLILKNEGASTDLSVTYEIGYVVPGDTTNTYVWLAPEDGGTVSNLTNANIPSSSKHGSESLAVGNYKFTVTNNDAVNTATVSLFTMIQNED